MTFPLTSFQNIVIEIVVYYFAFSVYKKEVYLKNVFFNQCRQTASQVWMYYRSRFQIEFFYRDAKLYGIVPLSGTKQEKT